MKADLSRSTFAQNKHYRDVRWQMGRVSVDADFNEQVDIAAHRVETETIDVVGESGAPVHDAAFQIAISVASLPVSQQAAATALGPLAAGDFFLSAGRYYVSGVMCENDAPIKFSQQADGDLPDAAVLQNSGLYLLYLDVWARHLTFLDDARIREVALGGPDTATREKNVWQVRAVRVGETGLAPDCDAWPKGFDPANIKSTGTLAAEVDPTPASTKPCVIPPGGGYRRQENQLYRVEIHNGGVAGGPATFKWSRDNGAVVSGWEATGSPNTLRLAQPPRDEVMGFSVGDSVELTDDVTDLLGVPGVFAKVSKVVGAELTLDAAVPAGLTRNPKVRRWDGNSAQPVATGAWNALEDGVRIRFSAGSYSTGDYWMIPARTATGDVEWPRDAGGAVFAAPRGIEHRYAQIGFADFDGTTITPSDCRKLFAPLTEIDTGGDLKLHNRHLHGKGVVCGLQVNCVGGDRTVVRVRPGHAIDCGGADILVKVPGRLNVVERAKALGLLDAQGSADVEITMIASETDIPAFDLRAAKPKPTGAQAILNQILEGTLWKDFYNDCLKPLTDYLRKELLDEQPNPLGLVSEQKKQLLTVMNLLAHRAGAAPNRRLWLSREQHEMLARLYAELSKLAGRSSTFCALLKDLAAFPDYPFANQPIDTLFVGKKVSGVRLIRDTPFAVAWSEDAAGQLHVFDLETREMVRDLKLPSAEGLPVQDATVTEIDGKPVVLIASADTNQTVFSILDPEVHEVLETLVLPGTFLTRIEAHPRRAEIVLAVERGRGLHFIMMSRLVSGPLGTPRWPFPAAGDLTLTNDRICLTETDAGVPVGSPYSSLRFGRLNGEGDAVLEDGIRLSRIEPTVASGRDGIALVNAPQGIPFLHVVVDPPGGSKAKAVLVIDPQSKKVVNRFSLPAGDDGGETGPVTVATAQRTGRVMFGLAKRNQLVWAPADGGHIQEAPTLPAQAAPVALSNMPMEGTPQFLLAANRESMTLTMIPLKLVDGIQIKDEQIGRYRDSLIAVFEQLFLILVQGLKDCLCEHLLIDCPECEPDEVLALAEVEIRQNEVFHICNFGRQEVLTFPKVKYWLSAIPLIPLVSYLVERFCCWVIPTPAAAPGAAPHAPVFTPAMALGAVEMFRSGQVDAALEDNMERARLLTAHFTRNIFARTPEPAPTPPVRIRLTDVINRNSSLVSATLSEKGVVVASVEDYDATLNPAGPGLSMGNLPASLKPGEFVRLYTRGENVVFYQVVPSGSPPPADPGVPPDRDVRTDVADLRSQLDRLRANQEMEIAARDRDLAELKLADVTLNAEVHRVAVSTDVSGTIDSLRQELAALKESHAAELADRDRQVAEIRTQSERLANELNVTSRKLQTDIDRISRIRPNG